MWYIYVTFADAALLLMRVLYDCTMLPMAAAADGLCFCCVKKIK